MITINDYIGKPWITGGKDFDGFDCWGLVVHASKNLFGLEIKNVVDIDVLNPAEVVGEIKSKQADPYWLEVYRPQEGDIAVMYVTGTPRHIGLMVNNRECLHSHGTHGFGQVVLHPVSVIKRLFQGLKFYRYVG